MTILLLFGRMSYILSQCIRECIVNASPKNPLGKIVKHRYYATAIKLKIQMRTVSTQNDTLGNLGLREVGEIYIRSPQVMKRYYKNSQATADTMDGNWYKTGDLGYYTEDDLLYVQGRLKEVIKVKRYKVAPTELEEVIRNYDDIQDVAVVGVAHDNYGEIPKTFVVPKSGIKINENKRKKFVAEHVAKYKRLGYIQVVESIPKTISGKILRRELQNL